MFHKITVDLVIHLSFQFFFINSDHKGVLLHSTTQLTPHRISNLQPAMSSPQSKLDKDIRAAVL